jgi:hypothetical protein
MMLVMLRAWPGIFFKLARCGHTLRATSQASYSPESITLTQKKFRSYQEMEQLKITVVSVKVSYTS